MKFELSHDFIAKQIYEKSSAEAKARRKVKSIVQRALQRHGENSRILLSAEDLIEIKLFQEMINFNDAEQAFIQKSQRVINQKRKLVIALVTMAFIVLSILVIWALNEQRNAKNEQKQSLGTALAAKSYEFQMKGDNTKALRFAQYAFQTTDRAASRQALFHTFFQRSKYYYHKSVKGDSNAIIDASFSVRDTPILMTTSLNGNIKFWNEELEAFKSLVHNHASDKIAISPDGDLIGIARSDSSLQLKSRTEATEGIFIKHNTLIDQIYFSPTDSIILSLTRNGTAWLWDYAGQPFDTLNNIGRVKSAAFSPDGRFILTAGTSGIKVWTKHGQFLESLSLINPSEIQFFPSSMPNRTDCYLFGCIYQDQKLKFWTFCEENKKIKLREVASIPDQPRRLIHFDVAHNGKLAVMVDFEYVALWQIQFTDNTIDLLPIGELKGHVGYINQAIFNPSGERLYTVSDDQTIKLWLLSSISRPFQTILNKSQIENHSIDKILEDSDYIISKAANKAFGNEEAVYKVWNLDKPFQPKAVLELKGEGTQVIPVSNGNLIASYAYDESIDRMGIQLWDSLGNQLARSPKELDDFISFHFLAGNKRLLTFQDNNRLKIWNLKGEIIDSLQPPGDFSSIDPSPTDSNLIAVLTDRIEGKSVIGIYNLEEKSLKNFYSTSELDAGGIVKFSPAGNYILSVHFDKIEIWSIHGELLESIVSFDESFSEAYFASEESFIIAIDGNNALVIDWTKIENQVATIENVKQAVFSENMEHLLIINQQNRDLEQWPFAPERVIKKVSTMKIADLEDSEKKRHGIEP